jgi:predicted lipoprotein
MVQSEEFDPVAYVDGIWDSQIMPTFNEGAVELSTVLSEIQVDAEGMVAKEELIPITEEYAHITEGEAHMYMVRGTGTIVNANTETSLGTIEVALDGYDGPVKVIIYVGTRIPNDETSIRDSVGFITINDFRDQMQYGKVGQEMNKRVLAEVVGDLDTDNLAGQTITFMGAFNIRTFNLPQIKLEEIAIVPVEMAVGE